MIGVPGQSIWYWDGQEHAVNSSYSVYENDYGVRGKGRDISFKLS